MSAPQFQLKSGHSRLREIHYPDSFVKSFDYDELNRRIEMIDRAGTTSWEYADVLGLDVTVTSPQGEIALKHNPLGQRTHLSYPDGIADLTYLYDSAQRLTDVQLDSTPSPSLAHMTYDSGNRLLTRTLFNGIQTQYGYDDDSGASQSMNRITSVKHLKSDLSTVLFHIEYPQSEYDDNGNRKQMKRTVFPFTDGRFASNSLVNYEYDATSQVQYERYVQATGGDPFLIQQYINDAAGNRETHNLTYFEEQRSIAGDYGADNRLEALHLTFPPNATAYDILFVNNNRGGRTEMTINPGGGQDSAVVGYDYNEDNQLIQLVVDAPGRQHLAQFLYNGDGLRVEKTVIGNLTVGGSQQYYSYTKRYLMDGVDVLLEKQVISESTEIVTSLYIPGIMLITVTGENELVIRYFLHDALGNVIALTDPNQEITAVYQYDGWGNVLVSPELQQVVSLTSNPVPTEVIHNPYRWGGAWGYYLDEDAGLYLLGLRWYESFTGRFLTKDPIGFAAGDPNLFRPVGNNTINIVDPWGLDEETWFQKAGKWLLVGVAIVSAPVSVPVALTAGGALLVYGGVRALAGGKETQEGASEFNAARIRQVEADPQNLNPEAYQREIHGAAAKVLQGASEVAGSMPHTSLTGPAELASPRASAPGTGFAPKPGVMPEPVPGGVTHGIRDANGRLWVPARRNPNTGELIHPQLPNPVTPADAPKYYPPPK